MTHNRYAIYYTAAQGPLADFGARWLGWDIATGSAAPHPDISDLPLPIKEITDRPRKYGLHGTIKPPFFLAQGTSADDLAQKAQALCARLRPVTLDGLALTRIGRFLALTPKGKTTALADLAAQIVTGLDPFRAPPSETELARRRSRRLSDRQEALLTQSGYPYVMEEFRFHLTLTGPVKDTQIPQVQQALDHMLAPILPRPFTINSLSLTGEGQDGRFETLTRFPLGAH